MSDTPQAGYMKILGLDNLKRKYMYVPQNYPLPIQNPSLGKWKLFVTRNWGIGSFDDVPSNPVIAGPNELCTETFVEFGPFETKSEVENVLSYLRTKFFRALLMMNKNSRHASNESFVAIPAQDFSEPWWNETIAQIDEHLFDKYNVPEDIRDYVRKNIQTKSEENIIGL